MSVQRTNDTQELHMDFLADYINEVIKKEGDGRYTDDYRDSGGPKAIRLNDLLCGN